MDISRMTQKQQVLFNNTSDKRMTALLAFQRHDFPACRELPRSKYFTTDYGNHVVQASSLPELADKLVDLAVGQEIVKL